jgi:subtilisin family serine protease
MDKRLYCTMLMLVTFSGSVHAGKLLPGGKGKIPGQYIVVLKTDADPENTANFHGLKTSHTFKNVFKGFSSNIPQGVIQRLLDDPDVEYIEPDGHVWVNKGKPTTKPGGGGEDSTEPPQVIPDGISRVGGGVDNSNSSSIAWVIDTGIDMRHPDLTINVSLSANFVSRGKNTPNDGNGHGTHVAGTIAAINNEIDVVGVAAGTQLAAVRVLDNSGSGSISGVVAGVDYVTANGRPGDVANLSLGALGHFQSLHDAITSSADTGVLYAVAAGNDSSHATNYEPAHIEHANVFTVSAMNQNDCLASFSNFGNPPVDYAAPGVGILSTQKGGGVTTLSGTSMATPHVAGLLLLSGSNTLNSDGVICGDRDSQSDPIAHF